MISFIEDLIKSEVGKSMDVSVAAPEKAEFGHYSTNVAFKMASLQKRAPLEIAKELADKFSGNKYFERVEAVRPGFVNFWLAPGVLQEEVRLILKKKNKYGKSKTKGQKPKVNIEFVSANPTGPLTMANGRGGFYGDVLANVLESSGYRVTREYYINDAGNQIFLLGLSILNKIVPKKVSEILKKRKDLEKLKLYLGAYIDELANTLGAGSRLHSQDPLKVGQKASRYLLKDIKLSLKKAGIKYDKWFSEDRNLHKKKELEKTLKFLKKRNLVEERDGALWLGSPTEGAVLVKSDGNPTYFLADLAYHYDKFLKRKFDIAINIWGADHHGYASRMEKGVEALGINSGQLQIIITQLVRLVRGGKEIRMSKRKGEFITMDDLLQEVGTDAARFFFLTHSPDTHMDFNLDLAKERSQKNPVYYAQYAYVRALNILKRANLRSTTNGLQILNSGPEVKLMLELTRFPDTLLQTAEDYQVQRLTKYAIELSRAFHNFYEKERVIGIDVKDLERARLSLVWATKIVLENLFDVLGISEPKKM